MVLGKIGRNILPKIVNITCGSSSATSAVSNVLKMRSQPICDTFSKFTFDDIYKVMKLGNDRIMFVPKIQQVNGKYIIPLEMQEYLFHFTSESNM